jgi:hypothetical protein
MSPTTPTRTVLHLTNIWPGNNELVSNDKPIMTCSSLQFIEFAVNGVRRTRSLLAHSIQYASWKSTKMMHLHLNVTLIIIPPCRFGRSRGISIICFAKWRLASVRKFLISLVSLTVIPAYSTPVGKTKCLAIVEESDQSINIFIEGIFNLNRAIRSRSIQSLVSLGGFIEDIRS